jgi:hypothetical protein
MERVGVAAPRNHGRYDSASARAPPALSWHRNHARRGRRLGGVGLPRRLLEDECQAAGTRRSRARARPARLEGETKTGVAAELCAYSAFDDIVSARPPSQSAARDGC